MLQLRLSSQGGITITRVKYSMLNCSILEDQSATCVNTHFSVIPMFVKKKLPKTKLVEAISKTEQK